METALHHALKLLENTEEHRWARGKEEPRRCVSDLQNGNQGGRAVFGASQRGARISPNIYFLMHRGREEELFLVAEDGLEQRKRKQSKKLIKTQN